jgi:flavorubredoxin
MNFRNLLAKHYINSRGWKTKRKIVVIESDDWGSIRMASPEIFNSLKGKGYPVDKHKFTSLDGLESKEDLKVLFEVLKSI